MKLSVRSLRALARKHLGDGLSRLGKADLVAQLRALPDTVRERVVEEVSARRGQVLAEVHGRVDQVAETARRVAQRALELAPEVVKRAPVFQSAHAVSRGGKKGKDKKQPAVTPPAEPSAPVIPSLSEGQALRRAALGNLRTGLRDAEAKARGSASSAAPAPKASAASASKPASSRTASEEGGSSKSVAPEASTTGPAAAPQSARAPPKAADKSAEKVAEKMATPEAKPEPTRGTAATAKSPGSAPAEAAASSTAKVRPARKTRRPRAARKTPALVDGFFVTPPSARARERLASAPASAPEYPEHLGDLPSAYDTEGTTALARDPHTLFVFWSFQASTVRRAAAGLKTPRAVLRVFEGDAQVREEPFDLAGRSFYVHGLTAGRTYRVEAYFVGADGRSVPLGPASNAVQLPPDGPSAITTLRFLKVPQGLPLARLREYVRDGRASMKERPADAGETEYFSWERFDLPGSAEGLSEKRVRRGGGPQGEGEGGEDERGPRTEGGGFARNESGVGRWPRPKSGRS